MSNPKQLDALAPDAPLIALLSIRKNPLLVNATQEELIEIVKKLRTHATTPATLTARLRADSDGIKPKNTISAKRKALLDTL